MPLNCSQPFRRKRCDQTSYIMGLQRSNVRYEQNQFQANTTYHEIIRGAEESIEAFQNKPRSGPANAASSRLFA